jgi:hypothetical protein
MHSFGDPTDGLAAILLHYWGDIGMDARNCQSILYPGCPSQESEHMAEAVRRILPERIKLRRDESRAAARPGKPHHEFGGSNPHVNLQ